MKKINRQKGNNLVEYLLTFAFVGFVFGYAFWAINPSVFKDFFQGEIVSNSTSGPQGNVTVQPLGE